MSPGLGPGRRVFDSLRSDQPVCEEHTKVKLRYNNFIEQIWEGSSAKEHCQRRKPTWQGS